METIDIGSKRTYGDVLFINKVVPTHNNRLAAAVTLLALVLKTGRRQGLTPAQKNRVLAQHPGLIEAIDPGRLCHAQTKLNETAAIVAYYRISQVAKPGQLEDFWGPLCSGAGLRRGDARIATQKFALNQTKRSHHFQVSQPEHYAAIIKAWNHWLDDKDLSIFKFGSFTAEELLTMEPLVSKRAA
jgi:hypothetical protein